MCLCVWVGWGSTGFDFENCVCRESIASGGITQSWRCYFSLHVVLASTEYSYSSMHNVLHLEDFWGDLSIKSCLPCGNMLYSHFQNRDSAHRNALYIETCLLLVLGERGGRNWVFRRLHAILRSYSHMFRIWIRTCEVCKHIFALLIAHSTLLS